MDFAALPGVASPATYQAGAEAIWLYRVANYGGTATLINSTLSGNSAGFNGGGLINENGVANLVHVTVVGNSASAFGGGTAR